METVDVTLTIHKVGNSIRLLNVTPAEAVLLREMHQQSVGKMPLSEFSPVKPVDRTNAVEIARLRSRYSTAQAGSGITWVEKLFPGNVPALPATFAEAGFEGVSPAAKPVEPAKAPAPKA